MRVIKMILSDRNDDGNHISTGRCPLPLVDKHRALSSAADTLGHRDCCNHTFLTRTLLGRFQVYKCSTLSHVELYCRLWLFGFFEGGNPTWKHLLLGEREGRLRTCWFVVCNFWHFYSLTLGREWERGKILSSEKSTDVSKQTSEIFAWSGFMTLLPTCAKCKTMEETVKGERRLHLDLYSFSHLSSGLYQHHN